MTNEITKWEERFHADESNDPMTIHMEREIAELRAKVESLEADAERYTAMKENDFTSEYCDYISDCLNERERSDLDNTIDAAMAKEKA